jgi:hypothetical protein
MSMNMSRYGRYFRITVMVGVIANWILAIPALLVPQWFLGAMGFEPTYPDIWVRLGALLLIMVSNMQVPAVVDMERYFANAVIAVVARTAVTLQGISARFLLFSAFDAAFAIPEAIFLVLALRERRRQPRAPEPRRKDTTHVAEEAAHAH